MGMISGLISSFLGVTCLAAAAIGYMFGSLKLWKRAILFAAVFMLVHPSLWTDLAGMVVIAVIALTQILENNRANKHTT